MPIQIEMPKLSDTMTEGTLISWNVAVGDEIEIGDVIAEIETDKASMEMEAFDEGVLTQILVQPGEKVPVGTTLATLAEDGEDVNSAPASVTSSSPVSNDQTPPSEPKPVVTSTPAVTVDGIRLKVSPLAKKIAIEKGVDLTTVTGSGPGGRVIAADIVGASAPTKSALTTPTKVTATPAVSAAINPVVADDDEIIPLGGMRKIIAERLLTSKQTIPHFYLHVEADVAPLMALRKQVNAQAEQTHGNKFTFNDFVVKAMINACEKVPAVNASFNGDSIVQFANVGVSVAIAVEDGLVTPVVKNAQNKSMLEISQEIKGMAVRAREKKLAPNEFDGGTITISNLGAWGIESFDAIVNPPQAAIVSVGGIIEKPIVQDGEIVPGMRMNIGLSCDHRVVDGAVAATYLNAVKELLEKPSLMLI